MDTIDESAAQADVAVQPPRAIGGGMLRRWAEVTAFVAIWIALGWTLDLDANAYLLLGIPLTAGFQRFVRGEPLRAMWAREAPPFGWKWIVPAVLFAILPAVSMVAAIRYQYWIIAGWMLAAVV